VSEIYSEVRTFTPEECAENLKNMAKNRRLNEKMVRKLARALTSGLWRVNGEAVQRNAAGQWMNGQHRFRASVQSGVPLKTLVVYNVPDDAMDTIDTGKSRTAADILSMRGAVHATILAGAINWIFTIDPTGGPLSKGDHASHKEIEDWWLAHPEIIESVERYYRIRHIMPQSLAVALHWLFSISDADEATRFFDDLLQGTTLEADDPVYQLRERLIALKSTRARRSKEDIPTLVIRAWNFRRSGQRGKLITASRSIKGQRRTLPEILP